MTYQAERIGAYGVVKDSALVRQSLSYIDKFGEPYNLYYPLSGGKLGVPRRLCVSANDETDAGCAIDFTMADGVVPREKQIPLIAQASELLGQNHSFILKAGTGIGKTVMAMFLMKFVGTRTIVVVDQGNIADQWVDAILKFTTIPEDRIGRLQGDKCDYEDKDVVIAMVQSLWKAGRYPPEAYKNFGLAIFDEVHVMGAEKFSKAIWHLNTKLRLGLSATPDRKNGRESVFESHIGPVAVASEDTPLIPKVLIVKTDWQCPRFRQQSKATGEWSLKRMPHQGDRMGKITKILGEDRGRNRIVTDLAIRAMNKGRNVVVFCDNLKHVENLYVMLRKYKVLDENIGQYVGGMKKEELTRASVRPVVLTTYKMTSKAVDCPWWDTAIMATPKSDVRQIIGRVLREYDGKVDANSGLVGTLPVVVDVVDCDSPVLFNYFKKRCQLYRDRGYPLAGHPELIDYARRA